MSKFKIPNTILLTSSTSQTSETYLYAVEEMERLLTRAGITVQKQAVEMPDSRFALKIGNPSGTGATWSENLHAAAYRIGSVVAVSARSC